MKKNLTRFVPEGMIEYKPEIGDYPKDLFTVYVNLSNNTAIFYTGKQSSYTWYNRFKNAEDMKVKINSTILSLMLREERKQKRRDERKSPTPLKLGDIMYCSWGYDQTNVDFYQIVGVQGKQTVKLRKIAKQTVRDSGSSTYVTAIKDSFVDDEITTHRTHDTSVTITSYSNAYLWDGKEKYETAFGYGH